MSSISWHPGHYFTPSAHCLPVRGYTRSALYDLCNGSFQLVSNKLYHLMRHGAGKPLNQLVRLGLAPNDTVLKTYLDFLQLQGYASYTEEPVRPKQYAPKNTAAITAITQASIDIGAYLPYHFKTLIGFLDSLGCRQLHLSGLVPHHPDFWQSLLPVAVQCGIGKIHLHVHHDTGTQEVHALQQLCATDTRHTILIHHEDPSQGENQLIDSCQLNSGTSLLTLPAGQPNYFSGKIHICADGAIKNTAECPEIFGYIQPITDLETLRQLTATKAFRKYWTVSKNRCDTCNVCEFRYTCQDKRLPLLRKQDEWYFSTECSYNPFIGLWKGDKNYRNLAECGVISNSHTCQIDHAHIQAILNSNKDNTTTASHLI